MSGEIKQYSIPENLIPESREIIEHILEEQRRTPGFDKTDYGHLFLKFVGGIIAGASKELNWDAERQRKYLRTNALKTLIQFGPNILNGFMKEKLEAQLTREDIEEYLKSHNQNDERRD